MIPITHFRRGNKVLYQGKPATIDSIGPNEISVLLEDGVGFWGPTVLGDVEGIPLTPEVLERAGFAQFHEEEGVRLKLSPEDELWWHFGESKLYYRSSFGGYYRGLPTKFLHQLQNLFFALTGEELQIKQS